MNSSLRTQLCALKSRLRFPAPGVAVGRNKSTQFRHVIVLAPELRGLVPAYPVDLEYRNVNR